MLTRQENQSGQSTEQQVNLLRQGHRRTLAQLLTAAENQGLAVADVLRACEGVPRRAHTIGVTGTPGVGKSTLVSALVRELRAQEKKVAVLAIDPSSPITGGSLLGDRVRMSNSTDEGVFYRSIASRDGDGGTTHTTGRLLRLLDLAGYDLILLETVGAGQSEVAVVHYAQTVLVVSAPGLGDDVQAHKAGIFEIGDIFVLNKADLEGAETAYRALRAMTKLSAAPGWLRPVIKTTATSGSGIEGLVEAVERHYTFLQEGNEAYRPRRHWAEGQLARALATHIIHTYKRVAPAAWDRAVDGVHSRRLDPLTAAETLLSATTDDIRLTEGPALSEIVEKSAGDMKGAE